MVARSPSAVSLLRNAFLEGPIAALTNSIDYVAWRQMTEKKQRGEGQFTGDWEKLRPERGLRAFGRCYSAWLTSPAWFRERWWSRRGLGFASVDEWIARGCEDTILTWDAQDLLVLSRMWQMADVGRVVPGQEMEPATLGGGVGSDTDGDGDDRYHKALRSIQAEALVMPCRTDQYFPPEDSEIEVSHLQRGTLAPIESIWGHAAGGGMNERDVQWMNGRIGEFLAG